MKPKQKAHFRVIYYLYCDNGTLSEQQPTSRRKSHSTSWSSWKSSVCTVFLLPFIYTYLSQTGEETCLNDYEEETLCGIHL